MSLVLQREDGSSVVEAIAGVNLWNASSPIRDENDDASREVVAACESYVYGAIAIITPLMYPTTLPNRTVGAVRFAGFRLIEAGLEQKQTVES